MSKTYNFTVTLSQAEYDALGFIAMDHQDWIDNAVHHRCSIAIDEIAQIAIQKCLEQGIQIPLTKEEIVVLAFDNKWVQSVAVTQPQPLPKLA